MTAEETAYRERCKTVLASLTEHKINVKETTWIKGRLHINAVFQGVPKTLIVRKENES